MEGERLVVRGVRGLPEVGKGVLSGGRGARAARCLHGEAGAERGVSERPHRLTGVLPKEEPRCKGGSRRVQGHGRDKRAIPFAAHHAGDVPVQVSEVLGQEISQPGKDHERRGTCHDVGIAHHGLRCPGGRRAVVAVDPQRGGRRREGVHRRSRRNAPVGNPQGARDALAQVTDDPAADRDNKRRAFPASVGGKGFHHLHARHGKGPGWEDA